MTSYIAAWDLAAASDETRGVHVLQHLGESRLVHTVDDLIIAFRLIFPSVFSDNPVPLKIGIHKDLFAELPLLPRRKIRMALARWCSSQRYRHAVANAFVGDSLNLLGEYRYDLNGHRVSRVSREEAERARRNKNRGMP